ncbi:type VI secretion system ATPase TssH [Larsenimonas suaedae]|uniref:Type VI secretion system ATPase TssH n=1 Tax=Larsenimonas suaedae TaxID=1851019 RepID=A0ABU1GVN7_9GAMM|nr:type VI secretion system ATPase TssH [Larsenimonas suaedae]MCM2973208.1 type VI secretion system ATPase TssH [Larsenimonas suaedae]MDR5896101.1 type VI secretion system ATPase TssH [Larsenimonas suaedae]
MIRVELPALIRRLNPFTHQALEAAASLCAERQGAEITVEHLMYALADMPLSDIRCCLALHDIDPQSLKQALAGGFADQPTTAEPYPVFSPLLIEVLQDAWLLASTEFGHSELRSGAVFVTVLMNAQRYLSRGAFDLLSVFNRETLKREFDRITADSAETPVDTPASGQGSAPAAQSGDSALARFGTNTTQAAREGRLDPVLGRDREVDQMIDILCRRRKNNPIAIGEAGVGKSALVEGLALRISEGLVPASLKDVDLITLDLGALQAGASVKGEFEKRLKAVIDEVKNASKPVILFIDEAHTLIGAGNQEGSGDAANLLKPALARGELRTVAATTWSEYKKYIEKDPALTRRFQPVVLGEPTQEQALHIMRGLRDVYERAHRVLIGDSGLRAAVAMSARYVAGRQLPDKAIDVLDTACARVAQAIDAPPRQISHLKSERVQCAREHEQLERERLFGRAVEPELLDALTRRIETIDCELATLDEAWQTQRALVRRILDVHEQLLDMDAAPAAEATEPTAADEVLAAAEAAAGELEGVRDRDALVTELGALETELEQLQNEHALVHGSVEEAQIAQVIGDWTGIPVERMTSDELSKLTELPDFLTERIKGQNVAIERIHRHLVTARADLRRPGRPMGAFLLVGPSGVGKTETVVQLAERLYGGQQFLTTINMSEYQEKHTVSRLIGSPPGYVGYGEGGLLTEAIRQKPYSVVLLDEVEKAHPEVLNLFYQAFDKGELSDGEGRQIDCQNVVFFMTSNLGFEQIVAHADNTDAMDDALYPVLADFFKPALLARMEVVPYLPLAEATLAEIVTAKLDTLAARIRTRYKAEVSYGDGLEAAILARATRSENGARMLESIIEGDMLPPVSSALLEHLANETPVRRVVLGVEEGAFTAAID